MNEEEIKEKRRLRIFYEKVFRILDDSYFAIWWCPKCKVGIMRRNEKGDIPFSKELFNGEGIWQSWICDLCSHEELTPFD